MYIVLYMLGPIIFVLILSLFGQLRINYSRAIAIACFFVGPALFGITLNILFWEICWAFSLILFNDWEVQNQGQNLI